MRKNYAKHVEQTCWKKHQNWSRNRLLITKPCVQWSDIGINSVRLYMVCMYIFNYLHTCAILVYALTYFVCVSSWAEVDWSITHLRTLSSINQLRKWRWKNKNNQTQAICRSLYCFRNNFVCLWVIYSKNTWKIGIAVYAIGLSNCIASNENLALFAMRYRVNRTLYIKVF